MMGRFLFGHKLNICYVAYMIHRYGYQNIIVYLTVVLHVEGKVKNSTVNRTI